MSSALEGFGQWPGRAWFFEAPAADQGVGPGGIDHAPMSRPDIADYRHLAPNETLSPA